MNKKIIIYISIILILLIGLNTVIASDNKNLSEPPTKNWKEVNIDGIYFKIPQKYANGELIGDENNYSSYMLNTVFDFSIASLNNNRSIQDIYGYESTIDELNDIELKRIGNHDTVILHSYRSVCEHNVTYIFFAIKDKIFSISFNGEKINSDIKQIIKNTPKSEISKKKLYNILDNAQEIYIERENEYEEAYAFNEGYSYGLKNSKNNKPNYADYYIAYRLTNYLMK